jgi:TfoX/Sxy family transcriptional regulator of competence genes
VRSGSAGPSGWEALAAQYLRQPGVARRRLFGSDGLSVNGSFFAFLHRDGLVLKLPPATSAALLESGDAVVATRVSPTMKRWVVVPDSHRWAELLAEAHAYARANQEDR